MTGAFDTLSVHDDFSCLAELTRGVPDCVFVEGSAVRIGEVADRVAEQAKETPTEKAMSASKIFMVHMMP